MRWRCEGLTLAEQAAVQLVAGVALQAVPEAGGACHYADQRRGVTCHDAQQPEGCQSSSRLPRPSITTCAA